jgi:hypothetical protein
MSKQKKHGHGNFIKGSVRVVDYDSTSKNILIRGSSAFGAKKFKMSDLISAIEADANFSGTGITLSSNTQIIDFCLIGFFKGHKDQLIVNTEMGWFTNMPPTLNGKGGPYPTYIPATAPSTNCMVYWPIQAIGGTPPTSTGGNWNPSPASSIGDGAGDFNYEGLVPAIRAALTNNTNALPSWSGGEITNAIIYIHCDSGVNRTGAAVCGYLMCYGTNVLEMSLARSTSNTQYTLTQAQKAANSAPPSNDTIPAGGCDIWVAQAYCNYLQTKNIDGTLVKACVPDPTPL